MYKIKLIVIGLLLLGSLSIINAQKQPNIIFILADDMGIGDVSAYNENGKIATPNIDRIANEGVKFTNVHTNSSVCTPTRYGIMTGSYAWRTELKQGVLGGMSPHLIKPNQLTIAKMLQGKGYMTACVGKWHLGMDWQQSSTGGKGGERFDMYKPIQNGPLDVGFDYYFGIAGSLNMAPHAFIEGRQVQGTLEFLKTDEDVSNRGFIGANTGWAAKEFEQDQVLSTFTSKTCNWIKENANEPFFLYMPLNSPHSPIVPRKDFKGKSEAGEHGDFCMETDWAVGQVLKTLDELNISDNTLIIFTADNGTSPKAHVKDMYEKGHLTCLDYRGLKGTLWEGGHRVPFVVRWPKAAKKNIETDAIICTTDFMATCADIINANYDESCSVDGISFLPALKGKAIAGVDKRMVVHHSDKGFFAIRKGKWKLVLHEKGGSNRKNPKDPDIINCNSIMLFDMQNDSSETINIAAKHPEKVKAMMQELSTIIKIGRSTQGSVQATDLETVQWPQIDCVRMYL